jgi:hypothetical protein
MFFERWVLKILKVFSKKHNEKVVVEGGNVAPYSMVGPFILLNETLVFVWFQKIACK